MFEIRLPRLGWSMEEGVFVGWLKPAGSTVKPGEPVLEMEGEKALQEIEAVDGGVLYVPPNAPLPGSTIPVGTLLGYLLQPGEAPPGSESAPTPRCSGPEAGLPPAGPAVRRLAREMGVNLHEVSGSGPTGKITAEDVTALARRVPEPTLIRTVASASAVATPRARRIAAELDIEWQNLPGTGRDGRIREADVRATPSGSPLPPGEGLGLRAERQIDPRNHPATKSVPISPRRKAIADRLRQSRERTIPVTLTTTADATAIVGLREQYKATIATSQSPSGSPLPPGDGLGVRAANQAIPAFTDIIAQIVVQVMNQHPALSVVWDAQQRGLISITESERHVGIAVDTPDGLLVPVVRHVAIKSLSAIAEVSKALIALARAGRLPADQMQGGVITITNLGAYGIDAFTPIINYPEIAILGLGAIRRELVVMPNGGFEARDRITLSLTFDHGAIDGAPAAAFLRDVVVAIKAVRTLSDPVFSRSIQR